MAGIKQNGGSRALDHCVSWFANPRNRIAVYLLLLALFSCRSVYRELGKRPLRADELIFSDVADGMHASGDWIHPQHTNGTPYLNKPPLYYWLTLSTYDLFGEGNTKYRFWSATFGLGCVLITAVLGYRMFGPETGGIAGWILLKNDLFIRDHGVRMGCFDSAITFFASACFLLYWNRVRRHADAASWSLLGLCAAAISMLKPGFGFLFLGLLIGYEILSRRQLHVRSLKGPTIACVVSALTIAPWYAAQWLHYGDTYTNAIFWANYVERAGGTLHPDHVRPVTFYLTSMSGSSALFALMLPAFVWGGWMALRGKHHRQFRYLLFLTSAIVGAFSLAKCKLHWYVFPIYPLTANMISAGLAETASSIARRYQSRALELEDEPVSLPMPIATGIEVRTVADRRAA